MQGQIDHNLFVTLFWAFFFASFAVSFVRFVARAICLLAKKGVEVLRTRFSAGRQAKTSTEFLGRVPQ